MTSTSSIGSNRCAADIVFGWRQLKRNKVTSFAAILSLALAIGACTSAFRLIDALLLRPLPVAHADRLYVLSRKGMGFDNRPGEWDSWAYPVFEQMRDAAKGQADLIAISYADRTDLTYKSDQEMEKANLQYVSGSMFDVFGLQPALGRLLTADDDRTPGAEPYAVLSYDYWTRRFASRSSRHRQARSTSAITVFQIVGVCEKKFTGTEPGTFVDIFVPTMMHRSVTRDDATWIRTLVILQPGVAPEPIRQKLAAISHAFEEKRLSGETDLSAETLKNVLANQVLMTPAPSGASGMQQGYSRALAALGALVFMVLLIACANVANLMTAQACRESKRNGAARIDRRGLGPPRPDAPCGKRIAWDFWRRSAGALFAWWSAPFVVSMINPPDNPARLALTADWRVLHFRYRAHHRSRSAIRPFAGVACLLSPARERPQRRQRSALASSSHAKHGCRAGSLLLPCALYCRTLRGDLP